MRKYSFAGALFTLLLGYAVVRYIVFKGVPWAHLPVYVANKAVSLEAMALLALAATNLSPRLASWMLGMDARSARRWLGLFGMALALLHVVMTLAILTPSYYGTLYLEPAVTAGLSLRGELALLAGALACVAMLVRGWLSIPMQRPSGSGDLEASAQPRMVGRGIVVLVIAHCVALGLPGWFTPSAWPGGMPPITLLACVIGTIALAFAVLGRGSSASSATSTDT